MITTKLLIATTDLQTVSEHAAWDQIHKHAHKQNLCNPPATAGIHKVLSASTTLQLCPNVGSHQKAWSRHHINASLTISSFEVPNESECSPYCVVDQVMLGHGCLGTTWFLESPTIPCIPYENICTYVNTYKYIYIYIYLHIYIYIYDYLCIWLLRMILMFV